MFIWRAIAFVISVDISFDFEMNKKGEKKIFVGEEKKGKRSTRENQESNPGLLMF